MPLCAPFPGKDPIIQPCHRPQYLFIYKAEKSVSQSLFAAVKHQSQSPFWWQIKSFYFSIRPRMSRFFTALHLHCSGLQIFWTFESLKRNQAKQLQTYTHTQMQRPCTVCPCVCAHGFEDGAQKCYKKRPCVWSNMRKQ